ncbi:hypothetical protein BRD06_00765 [Halobacteriales archaeon QS_9_67_15]|nr:MAG: hypothetical protein BRD06_00765 [Halobacteriales archaeon QS_9_67_15]
MVELPWRGDSSANAPTGHADAAVACSLQDGTLAVYEDRVVIERVPRSKFSDKTIPLDDVSGVEYERGVTVGYIQVRESGVEADTGGLLSDPVDENTLHFAGSGRACALGARDALRERIGE